MPHDCITRYTRLPDREGRRWRVALHIVPALTLSAILLLLLWRQRETQHRPIVEVAVPEVPASPMVEVNSVGGWLNYTLVVQAGILQLPRGISFSTRLYNGRIPSPILRATPGDRVRLLVQNELGPIPTIFYTIISSRIQRWATLVK